jgi:hypothetical protein
LNSLVDTNSLAWADILDVGSKGCEWFHC